MKHSLCNGRISVPGLLSLTGIINANECYSHRYGYCTLMISLIFLKPTEEALLSVFTAFWTLSSRAGILTRVCLTPTPSSWFLSAP